MWCVCGLCVRVCVCVCVVCVCGVCVSVCVCVLAMLQSFSSHRAAHTTSRPRRHSASIMRVAIIVFACNIYHAS